mmetsp:Transcript_14131/g.23921  ORF Transcript_14131/g.23921 Transcript_14131/m.23921 type:complete len:312 (-) Transcript_14131:145-1080(-)|eukprot:CAMPEP_0198198772 /NCGR_PEP_ID=MMETSP1445-20131203/2166_1 /TAXON_ID=36898 /ORGANISM="Pyramimonas sp., Strain CCMP2087" /LENGTH=311 /DNA_ID=CAMNT_0043868411 /DNA_START=173 /DNA_END=1108 /DNA_ORIENTATION=-
MQYYTKQQLQGAARYGPLTHVGNWNEEKMMQDVKMREYILRRENGELNMDKFSVRMRTANTPVELSTAKRSEFVLLGDVFQLRACEVDGVLAVDMAARDPRDLVSHSVTFAPNLDPCARNAFTFEKYEPRSRSHTTTFMVKSTREELCYGELVMIRVLPAAQAHPDYTSEPLYLHSSIIDTKYFSKKTKNQEVRMAPGTSYAAAWKVVPVNAAHRDLAEGEPVMAGAPVVLVHCNTNADLCCPGVPQTNDFGSEYEACACTVTTMAKSWKLLKDQKGSHDSMHDAQTISPNHFVLITGNLLEDCEVEKCEA